MRDFELYLPTRSVFGRDAVEKLASVMPKGVKRVLVTSGKSSVRKSGLYDRVLAQLKEYEVYELSGIPANPKLNFVYEGIELCRKYELEAVVAIGGGSVIDCSKIIAASYYMKRDPWEYIMSKDRVPAGGSLPVIDVATMAATGTETNSSSVIVKEETGEKVSLYGEGVIPYASIYDPVYYYTVPAYQTAAGCVDVMSHVMETYFVEETNYLSDLLCEATMKTIVKYAPVALKEPDNYEARGQIIWASEIGDNGSICMGNSSDAAAVHYMEHEISGHYNTTHGAGLAVLTPNWMRYILSEKTAPKLARFGREVMGVEAELSDMEAADRMIVKLREFFTSLGMPATLSEMGVGDDRFEELAKRAENRGTKNAWVPLSAEDVLAIFKMSF